MKQRAAQRRRDAGLARLRRTTRWAAAGALGLAGLFTGLVSHALPGRSATAPRSAPATTQPALSPTTTPDGGGVSTPNLRPPAQTPTAPVSPPRTRAPVVSGGS